MTSPSNVVFDLDGVLYVGPEPVMGAGDALRAVAEIGARAVFATNNSTKTPMDVAMKIAAATGVEVDPGRIVTSSVAALALLEHDDDPVLAVGEAGLFETLRAAEVGTTTDPDAAAAVVVGLDRSFDYATMERATRAVRNGARFIATNTDATFPTPTGPVPGGGAIVASIERASGVVAEVAGKPHPPMLAAVRSMLEPGPTWVVGDRPETDLALAVAGGWTKVLVLTGVTAHADEVPEVYRPDIVLRSVATLAEHL